MLPSLHVAGRADRVRSAMGEHGCEALVVSDLTNIRYLTGFTGSAGVLVVRAGDLVLVTDGRYEQQVADQLADARVAADLVVTREVDAALAATLAGLGRVGVEADHVTWDAQRRWSGAIAGELVPTVGLVLALRAVKDEGEVARLEHAAAIADEALAQVRPLLLERPTEREVARALEAAMLDGGAHGPSFESIVASGPNSARPHARPSERTIAEGDLVVVDFGALYDGYHSDMTRTFTVGEPTPTQQRMIDVVARSQAAGVATVRAGVRGVDVDGACRQVIDEAGWADAFVHGTGHGIGLVIHEEPRLSPESSSLLAPGHCVTVEPGVYLPEHGGVRIEDSLVVTATGCRPLTASPYDPAP
ncbi:MAG TPA: Xaa-Pro peptidase family protein [Acidimicrobiales bacterium]|nr:Xaa-Pro peptidase family protein [Acidimicrobiales bacterium]